MALQLGLGCRYGVLPAGGYGYAHRRCCACAGACAPEPTARIAATWLEIDSFPAYARRDIGGGAYWEWYGFDQLNGVYYWSRDNCLPVTRYTVGTATWRTYDPPPGAGLYDYVLQLTVQAFDPDHNPYPGPVYAPSDGTFQLFLTAWVMFGAFQLNVWLKNDTATGRCDYRRGLVDTSNAYGPGTIGTYGRVTAWHERA